ncbi:MAG: CDP-alcohol phosphatidyltransferase family protein [Bacteroidota bacterium]
MKRAINFANALSVMRLFLIAPIIYFFEVEKIEIAWFLIFVAIISDSFDGYFSRKNNEVTEFGKIIDPLADKFCVIGLIIYLLLINKLEFWYVALVFVRDLAIMLGSVHLKISKGFVLMSNWEGKVTVVFTTIYILLSLIDNPSFDYFAKIILAVNILYLFYSFYLYVKIYFKVLKEKI